jgi:surfeit locus 1 family protein
MGDVSPQSQYDAGLHDEHAQHAVTPPGGRSPLFRAAVGTAAVLFLVLFVILGDWQVKRRAWKLDLIARVEQRVHADPVGAPRTNQWPRVTAATDEYRHVTVTGRFLDDSQTFVQAVTALGSGWWVLTPLRTEDGSVVLINRGFVPADVAPGGVPVPGAVRKGTPAITGTVVSFTGTVHSSGELPALSVTGLLRMTEPGGGFLRHNDPAANRWYSRDVQAIAAARGLKNVAPFFIDADAAPAASGSGGGPPVAPKANNARTTGDNARTAGDSTRTAGDSTRTAGDSTRTAGDSTRTAGDNGTGDPTGAAAGTAPGAGIVPVGGLTVITFHNSHLVYAITWYTLALMMAGAIWIGVRNETRA